MTGRALIIGYGNVLRTDDGVGRQVAEGLALDPRLAAATVLGVHQLTPELALDLSRADLLVLIDAGHGPAAGTCTVERVAGSGRIADTWSHHLDPAGLVALAGELYGHAPAAFVVTVGVESLDAGDRLSPVLEAALPRVVDAVVGLVTEEAQGVPAGDAGHA
jgi:hydrogenase maturation protease